jgi:hypothetical protein
LSVSVVYSVDDQGIQFDFDLIHLISLVGRVGGDGLAHKSWKINCLISVSAGDVMQIVPHPQVIIFHR